VSLSLGAWSNALDRLERKDYTHDPAGWAWDRLNGRAGPRSERRELIMNMMIGASALTASAGTMKALNPATGQLIEPEFALGRAAGGRNPEPTAAVIDSQSARAAGTVPRASRG
jgi:hypothetical protein